MVYPYHTPMKVLLHQYAYDTALQQVSFLSVPLAVIQQNYFCNRLVQS